MQPTTSPLRQAWYHWKALRLPWRKRFLVGLDLEGNTFWEFRDTLSSHKHRMRRIVQYRLATQLSDVRISPQWHSWLRHTRNEPPSLVEQSRDLVRQEDLKVLAAQADARWAAKGSILGQPRAGGLQTPPELAVKYPQPSLIAPKTTQDSRGLPNNHERSQAGQPMHTRTAHGIQQKRESGRKNDTEKADPWKQARGAPGEEWQPESWDGTAVTPR